jgi:hypothetical protein
MSKRSNKRSNKGKITKKQKTIFMIGCSKNNNKSCRNKKVFSTLGNKPCPNCGINCHCKSICKCPKNCPGNCYLNRTSKKYIGGDSGCGPCGCPIPPFSWTKMNQFGGSGNPFPLDQLPEDVNKPVIISPPEKGFVPILGIGQNGGNCNVCGQIPVIPQRGGINYRPIGPMPGPLVGHPWGPPFSKWPGVDGIGGDRNYFKPYNTNNDPQQQMTMNDAGYTTLNSKVGGSKYNKIKHSIKSKKGGGFLPQDLVNLGRDFTYNVKSVYNTLNGYNAPVNPAPFKDQLTGSINSNRFIL